MRLHPARAVGLLRAPWIPGWSKDPLWRRARAVPSLDLRFADNKSLVDATTGQNLIDFSRASIGTYVDSQGVIRNATTNLLLRSEEFDDASWIAATGTVTPNAIIAPDGTLTADYYYGNGVNVGYLAKAFSFTSGVTYTYSVYAKKANTSSFTALFYGTSFDAAPSTNTTATFNFDTESITYVGGNITGSMTSVGNGWYRCTATVTAIATGTTPQQLVRLTGVSGDVYLWGAQLEESSTVGEYIPTTSTINSAPRFDHDPETGESLGLLVEESRTNNLLQSESVTTSPWGAIGSPTFTVNNAISPAGDLTSDLVIGNNSEAFAGTQQILSSLVIGNNYSVSLFVKPNTATTTRLGLFNSATTQWNFYVDIVWTAGVPSTQATGGSPTNIEYQSYGNGWYRCSLTGAVDTVTPQFLFQPDRTATSKSAWIWGASVESGSAGASALFPTSYIPTEGSTVTRAADVASIEGTNFSSWYRQDEGTIYANAYREHVVPASNFPHVFDARNTNDDVMQIAYNTEIIGTAYSRTSGVDQAVLYPTNLNSVRRRLQAFAYKTNDYAVSANGGPLFTDNSGTPSSVINQAVIGARVGSASFQLNGTIKRLTFWPTRLGNDTLQSITR